MFFGSCEDFFFLHEKHFFLSPPLTQRPHHHLSYYTLHSDSWYENHLMVCWFENEKGWDVSLFFLVRMVVFGVWLKEMESSS